MNHRTRKSPGCGRPSWHGRRGLQQLELIVSGIGITTSVQAGQAAGHRGQHRPGVRPDVQPLRLDLHWASRTTCGALYNEPLLKFNIMQPTQAPIPWLATGYAWSNSGKTLTFTIRPG